MKRLLIMAVCAMPMLTVSAADGDDFMESPRFLLAGQGDSAMAQGRYMDAAARFSEAIAIAPDLPDNSLLMSNLAMAYFAMGNDSLALTTLDNALALTPAMTTLKSNRARVLLSMGRDREAYLSLTDVLLTDSLNAEARFYHGYIALYSGDAAVAEKDFGVLESLEPNSPLTLRAMASLYSLTGRDARAIPYFERLIADDPQVEYYAALAGCQLALQRLSDASATIGQGMNLYPGDPELLYYRAWLRRDQFRLDEARDDLRQAVRAGLSQRKAAELMP